MSNDEGRTGEGKLRDRLKRRRAQRASADTVPNDGGSEYEFGYGGWSITLAGRFARSLPVGRWHPGS